MKRKRIILIVSFLILVVTCTSYVETGSDWLRGAAMVTAIIIGILAAACMPTNLVD